MPAVVQASVKFSHRHCEGRPKGERKISRLDLKADSTIQIVG